jgi:hypothetical protein
MCEQAAMVTVSVAMGKADLIENYGTARGRS